VEQLNYELNFKDKDTVIPVSTQRKSSEAGNGLLYAVLAMNVILMVAVVTMLFRPSPSPQPGPGPSPGVISEDVPSMVVDAERNLAVYEAEISEQLADAVLNGKIKDPNQFYSMASAAQQKAEDKAFSAMNALNNKYISTEKWNKEIVSELQLLKAKGKRMVAK